MNAVDRASAAAAEGVQSPGGEMPGRGGPRARVEDVRALDLGPRTAKRAAARQ